MSTAVRVGYDRFYPTSLESGYASTSLSGVSEEMRRTDFKLKHAGTPTVRNSQPALLSSVWDAVRAASANDWDGDNAIAVSAQTATAAMQLVCALPEGLPPPTITPEPTGEIAFEWYKDSRHVAVVTVQDGIIRWSALLGTNAPVYGREFFSRTVPSIALQAIQATSL